MSNIAQTLDAINSKLSNNSSVEDICIEMRKAMYAVEMLKSTIPADILEAIEKHEETITAARELLKEHVVKTGETFKSDFGITIIYNNGKTSWDSKKLEGYAVSNPDILKFKTTGKPYASIKESKVEKAIAFHLGGVQ